MKKHRLEELGEELELLNELATLFEYINEDEMILIIKHIIKIQYKLLKNTF